MRRLSIRIADNYNSLQFINIQIRKFRYFFLYILKISYKIQKILFLLLILHLEIPIQPPPQPCYAPYI